MTEKRFIGSCAGIYDKYKKNRWLWSEWEEITTILNNLNEKSVERSKALSKLQKENEQLKLKVNGLKSEVEIWKEDANEHIKETNKLFEENKQLKQTIKEIYEILSTDVDVFSEKATEHDINAYVELRELDNKDAYYIAKGTKKAIELLKRWL